MVEPWQREIKTGDHILRAYEPEGGSLPILIFGSVEDPMDWWVKNHGIHSEAEARQKFLEGKTGDALEDGLCSYAEYMGELESRQSPHMRNFRFVRAYSTLCPEGELGDWHISTVLCVLTPQQFKEASEALWQPNTDWLHAVADSVRNRVPGTN